MKSALESSLPPSIVHAAVCRVMHVRMLAPKLWLIHGGVGDFGVACFDLLLDDFGLVSLSECVQHHAMAATVEGASFVALSHVHLDPSAVNVHTAESLTC